jgi:pimeloyl-ACP methyl ester carboxylesterase
MLRSSRVDPLAPFHLLVEGEGEPVVLLHAGASSSHQWGSLVSRLGARHRVLAPDLRGEGRTPAPRDWSRMLEGDVALVSSVIDAAGGRVHLVGHSYGAVVAMACARARPAAVRSLALIEPVAFHLLRTAPAAIVGPVVAARDACVAAMEAGEPAHAAELFVDYWGGEGSFARLPRPARAGVTAAVGKCAHGWRVIFDEPDTLADFAALRIPSVVLAGTRSPAPARWIAERLAEALPLGALVEVTGGGHMSPMTHAEIVNGIVDSHLARHTRARRVRAAASGAIADGGE